MKMRQILAIFSLFLFFHVDQGICGPKDSSLSLFGKIGTYMNNLEYSNEFREGATHLGAQSFLGFRWNATEHVIFELGAYVRKLFGDTLLFTDARPILSAGVMYEHFRFIIGEFTRFRPYLIDALLKYQYSFDPGIDEGLMVGYQTPSASYDAWVSWYSLNTPNRREHFSIGTQIRIQPASWQFSVMALAEHYGGQQFAPVDDPVRENLSSAGEVAYTWAPQEVVQELKFSNILYASATRPDRGQSTAFQTGWGAQSKLSISMSNWKLTGALFYGKDFTAWQGNPLYQIDGWYFFIQSMRSFQFSERASLEAGIRFDIVDKPPVEYIKHLEHEIRLLFEGTFDHAIHL